MKLILHIGTEKTGSTTIQQSLFLNRKVLKSNGFNFIQSAGERNHIKLAMWATDDDKSSSYFEFKNIKTKEERITHKEDFANIFDIEMKSLRQDETVVISSEHLHSRVNSVNEVSKLKFLLDSYFDEVQIICYVREQSAMCSSFYSTAIKGGGKVSLNDFTSRCVPSSLYYNYNEMLKVWESVFGGGVITLKIFDRKAFKNGDLLEDFYSLVDKRLFAQLESEEKMENTSLSLYGLFINRALNTVLPNFDHKGVFAPARQRLQRQVNEGFSGKCNMLIKSESDRIYDEFLESNNELAAKYFIGKSNLFERSLKYKTDEFELTEADMSGTVTLMKSLLAIEKDRNPVGLLLETANLLHAKSPRKARRFVNSFLMLYGEDKEVREWLLMHKKEYFGGLFSCFWNK